MKYLTKYTLLLVIFFASCTDLTEEMHSSVGANNFLESRENVLQTLSTTYAYSHTTSLISWLFPQELTADLLLTPTRGVHGYNAGEYLRLTRHTWTNLDRGGAMAWDANYSVIGFANAFIEDIEPLDYSNFGMSDEEKSQHLAEARVLRAFAYWKLLDIYGGVPIATSITEDPKPRNSSEEVFRFIETELNETLSQLPVKTSNGNAETVNRITQGANRFLLMRLYFNSEAYIDQPMYSETMALAQSLINGEFGDYDLDSSWNGPFRADNLNSPENVFAYPIEMGQRDEKGWWFGGFHHYESHLTFGSSHGGAGWNGWGLAPSITAEGDLLEYDLGMPYSRFDERDVRKRNWNYIGNGDWEGMFLAGPQMTYDGSAPVLGVEEYAGQPLVLVDYVAGMSEGKTESHSMLEGEENTGIRPVKVTPPYPDEAAQYQAQADQPEMRMAEVYFTLAECQLRAGDKGSAAQTINQVIQRNYEDADWNDASLDLQVTAADLDDEGYRMLEEWAKEFLMEPRRRIDLIRWDKYTTGTWFDHNEPSEDHRKRMPIPYDALNANPLLEQNPGYN